jgi:nitrogen fixation protein NifB
MNVIPFPQAARRVGRATDAVIDTLRLPVAPRLVSRLRFAPDTKPIQALTPAEALMEAARHTGLAKVELVGPGDPLASMATTLEVIALLKGQYPALTISLTSLGIGGAEVVADLAAAGLGSVNLLVDTLEAATAEQLYAWIRPEKKTVPLPKVVPLLLEEQSKTVSAMATAGIAVSIRTTVYPGINAGEIEAIAETMAALGAKELKLAPFFRGSHASEGPVAPTRVQMEQLRHLAGKHLPAVIVGADCSCAAKDSGAPPQPGLPRPSAERSRVAVASATGMEVDLHLGQAKTLLIYGPRDDGLTCLLETRQAPDPGGETRWEQLAAILHDCFVLLAANAGQRPREVLGSRGIRVLITEESIEGTVDVLFGGGKKQKCGK